MTVKNFIPAPALQLHVKAFKIIGSLDGDVNRILPGTSLALAFRLNGRTEFVCEGRGKILPSAVLSGLRRSVRLIDYAPGTSTLVVLFTATGASAFFRQPLHELFEKSVGLDEFFLRSEIDRVEAELFETESDEDRVRIVERFLLARMIADGGDRLVLNAVRRIENSCGLLKMKELACSFYLSQDAFEKRFRKMTGARPKQYASIVRLQHIASARKSSSLTHLAYDNGYFDQSHFNKDVKLFTGLTPGELFTTASFW